MNLNICKLVLKSLSLSGLFGDREYAFVFIFNLVFRYSPCNGDAGFLTSHQSKDAWILDDAKIGDK